MPVSHFSLTHSLCLSPSLSPSLSLTSSLLNIVMFFFPHYFLSIQSSDPNLSRSSESYGDEFSLDDLIDSAVIAESSRHSEETRDGDKTFHPPRALKRKAHQSDGPNIRRKDVFNDDPFIESESSYDDDMDDDMDDDSDQRKIKGPLPVAKRAPDKAKRSRGGGKVMKVDPNETVTHLLTELVNNQRALMEKKTPTDTAVSLF
jgi:hypothetical protein